MKQLSSLVVLLSSASSSDKKRPVTKISFSMGNVDGMLSYVMYDGMLS